MADPQLVSVPSIPIPERPNTRNNGNQQNNDHSVPVQKVSFMLTPTEWKAAYSQSKKKMNPEDIYQKVQEKKNSKPFWCRGNCKGSECTRSYYITLENKPDIYTSALFMMEISGIEKHNPETETMTRQLRGVERLNVGERINNMGPLAVFRERVEAADEN
ncbi:unnamed protein product [Adineta ricciae]|uniref:Uncharacterized protein n=1 Tax=Adineta ricciae TaxID=249248 RepID=A0A816FBS1_ADIRI|nr:unnamed protein product [Adineta ricciae]CAF1658364.1 unnamed protein product [Adineta ricciae]